jgi:hypothetical protein
MRSLLLGHPSEHREKRGHAKCISGLEVVARVSGAVCGGAPASSSNREKEVSMIYKLMGYAHAVVGRRVREIYALAGERGQGTVEYVGLILLVSLLMVGMVAAMKGFNGKQGTELADVIVNKIKEAVDKVAFK